jgi:tetratricopeptide (TPR) repeat protein
LSTSKDRDVSFAFADSNRSNPDLIGVLFQITIDGLISSPPFALLHHDVSNFAFEQEILFSMHTVFRINEIEKLDDKGRLWQVKLQLTSDSDPQLGLLTKLMRGETEGTTGWSRLGNLLIKVGEFDKAEQIYKVLLDQTSEDDKRADFYYQLGWIKNDQGKYQEALSFYGKALEIRQKILPPNHPSLAESYSNIGLVYDNMGEYSKALSFYEKTLEIDENTTPLNHLDLASSYNNIGVVYDKMGEYSKALLSHEKALHIREKALPPNHPTLAISYSTIGLVYASMGEYSKALSSHEKAIEIRQKSQPSNHPDFATSYNNIAGVYTNMGEYSKALLFHEKAIEIKQKSFSLNHPHFATSYNNIAMVYDNMGE